jgi:hypothetical protein
MVHNAPLDQLEEDSFLLSREVVTPVDRVETTQGDDGLLEQLVIQGDPLHPGVPVLVVIHLGRSHDLLVFQKLIKKATKYQYLKY